MARQRTLTAPVVVSVDGASTNYDLVRIIGMRMTMGNTFLEQRVLFQWTMGRMNKGVWESANHPSLAGVLAYDNVAANGNGDLKALLTRAAWNFKAIFDLVLADLETAGKVKAGTESDFAMEP